MADFNYVELQAPKESGFDLSYSYKTTTDLGKLTPVLMQECLPGDEFKLRENFMVRLAPLANPIFTKIDAEVHYFFVPNRIIWDGNFKDDNFETFITGGRDGSKTPAAPHITMLDYYNYVDNSDWQKLGNYFGIPNLSEAAKTNLSDSSYAEQEISLLPFMAYQKIFDDWYRDQNLTQSVYDVWDTADGFLKHGGKYTDTREWQQLFEIRHRAFDKDYFTSALPFSQRGEDVHIPSGVIRGNITNTAGGTITSGNMVAISPTDTSYSTIDANSNETVSVLGATIRDLRNASRLQLFLEKNALGGGRYIEQMLSHFGVYGDDARLQRAEYLGSVKSPVVVSEINGTATTDKSELGEVAGKGLAYGGDFAFDYKCKEHGFIIGILSIVPEATYADGISRTFTHRNTKLQYAFPEFAEIGMEPVYTSELNLSGAIYGQYDLGDADFVPIFGYQERYMDYKCNNNRVTGKFADRGDTLSQYNMTYFQDGQYPTELTSSFISVNEGALQNPFVDTTNTAGNFWVDMLHDLKAIRPLPKTTIPLIY
mgnify:CR=1 FL=1